MHASPRPPLAALTASITLLILPQGVAHDGPTPQLHWSMKPKFLSAEHQLEAQKGPNLQFDQSIKRAEERNALVFRSNETAVVAPLDQLRDKLPTQNFTAMTVASVHTPREYGGLFTALQDNGNAERGWAIGYTRDHFYIALSTEGADDGDGAMTYLKTKTKYQPGKLYHIAATYDGTTLSLYLNGELEATSTEQSGAILYPKEGKVGIAGYIDRDEDHPHHGEIQHLRIYNQCARPAAIEHDYQHAEKATTLPPSAPDIPLEFVVRPYLQFATTNSVTVMWETSTATETAKVSYGGGQPLKKRESATKQHGNIHEVTLSELKPDTQYFYQVRCTKADGTQIETEPTPFRTAPTGDTPFAFAIISDTQHHHKTAAKTLAEHAWDQRPSFLLHPGDLVDNGNDKRQWVEQFFTSLGPLIAHVPFYPVLGNHERNADLYYAYMSLPDPEFYYTFHYGNAQFFMVDTNKKVGPGSEQYKWLDQALAESTADWKFLCHHQPAYTSDSDDYGNLWKSNRSSAGDPNSRHLAALCDKHQVDIVFNGHIHNYERTWPLKQGRPTSSENGTLYLITGGGGGHLEQFAPTRHPFTNHLRRAHHYAMVHINGDQLEYRAFDLENRLFDQFTLKAKADDK